MTDGDSARDRTGPRGTMADVSHTPPGTARSAADVFARGGEPLGPMADERPPDGDPEESTSVSTDE